MGKKMKFIIISILLLVGTLFSEEYYEYGSLVELTPVTSSNTIHTSSIISVPISSKTTYYKTQSGQRVGVERGVIIKVKDGVDVQKLVSTFPIKSIDSTLNPIFLLTIFEERDIFDISRKLYESEYVIYAQPNFTREKRSR
jgi:hypothetical protein